MIGKNDNNFNLIREEFRKSNRKELNEHIENAIPQKTPCLCILCDLCDFYG
jgi:hypothetical protein